MKKDAFLKKSFSLYNLLMFLSLFFLVLYPYSVSLNKYIYPSTVIKYITLLFAALSFAFLCLVKQHRKKIKINKTEIMMLIIGIYISINSFDNRNGSYYYSITFAVIWIILVYSKYLDKWQNTLYKLLELFTLFYAMITIVCFLFPNLYFSHVIPLFDFESQKQLIKAYQSGYMAGLTDHYSTNGMYLSIGLGVFVSKLINNLKSKKYIIYSVIMLAALLLTGKRGPLLFSVMALVVVYYIHKEDMPKGRILKILGIMLFAVIMLLIASIWIPQLLNVINRFFKESNSGDVTAGRGPLFDLALSLFKKKPIFGYGWGSYPYYYYINLGKFMTVYKYRHAHNIYLQLLCETGIVGFIMYIVFIFINLHDIYMLYKMYRKDKLLLPYSANYILPYCLFTELFFVFYGMTGNPLYDAAVLFPYYFCIIFVNYYKNKLICVNSTRRIIEFLYKKGVVIS